MNKPLNKTYLAGKSFMVALILNYFVAFFIDPDNFSYCDATTSKISKIGCILEGALGTMGQNILFSVGLAVIVPTLIIFGVAILIHKFRKD